MTRHASGFAAALTLATISLTGWAEGRAKIHIVLGGGPYAGKYDVTAEECLAGIQKKGSWHATWQAEREEKGKISAVLLGIDPKPTFGNGLTMSVHFGEPDSQIMYEVQKPTTNVVDKGATATLTFKGEARTVNYADGTFGNGGLVEITVECGSVKRGE